MVLRNHKVIFTCKYLHEKKCFYKVKHTKQRNGSVYREVSKSDELQIGLTASIKPIRGKTGEYGHILPLRLVSTLTETFRPTRTSNDKQFLSNEK